MTCPTSFAAICFCVTRCFLLLCSWTLDTKHHDSNFLVDENQMNWRHFKSTPHNTTTLHMHIRHGKSYINRKRMASTSPTPSFMVHLVFPIENDLKNAQLIPIESSFLAMFNRNIHNNHVSLSHDIAHVVMACYRLLLY